jgi:hypothetical protein
MTQQYIPLTGSAYGSQQFNSGPPAWLDIATVQPPQPWTVYSDLGNRIMGQSQQGVDPVSWTVVHPLGNKGGLYSRKSQLWQGHHEQVLINHGDDPTYIRTVGLPSDHLHSGPRGNGLVSPYTTWHSHRTMFKAGAIINPTDDVTGQPIFTNIRMPFYIGIRFDSMILLWNRDHSISEVRTVPYTLSPFDFTFDEQNPSIFYVASTMNGNIVKVDRTIAASSRIRPHFEDVSLWQFTVIASGIGKPTSVRLLPNGDMFIADNKNGMLLHIDVLHRSVTSILSMPGIFWIDYLSDNRLVLMNSNTELYWYDWQSGTLSSDLLAGANMYKFGGYPFANLFLQCNVDRLGTIGKVDSIYWCRTHGLGNVDAGRTMVDGSTILQSRLFGNGAGEDSVGSPKHVKDPVGHYCWSIVPHVDQPLLLLQGNSDDVPFLIMPKQPYFAAEDIYDSLLAKRGHDLMRVGTVGHELQYPSFTCQMNSYGGGGYTSFDYIAMLPFGDMVQFVQQGMLGNVPRPDLVGYDLLALLYYACKNSQRYLQEGSSFITALRNYIGPQSRTNNPVISIADNLTICMGCTNNKITFTDIYEHTVTTALTTTVEVTLHTGIGQQVVLGTYTSPWLLPSLQLQSSQQAALSCKYITGGTIGRRYLNHTSIVIG